MHNIQKIAINPNLKWFGYVEHKDDAYCIERCVMMKRRELVKGIADLVG